MLPALPESWRSALDRVWEYDPSVHQLREFLAEEYANETVYPNPADLFTALKLTPPDQVKAVILGQDPYHGPNQAHGLAFSVQPGVTPPASLRNIFKELKSDAGVVAPPGSGDLSRWARDGVLLLNSILTVRAGQPLSHRNKGWETFTDAVLKTVSEGPHPVAFVLWGAHAQKKLPLIDVARHDVIQSVHPSPLSAHGGFFGSKPYSQVNEALRRFGREPVDWRLD